MTRAILALLTSCALMGSPARPAESEPEKRDEGSVLRVGGDLVVQPDERIRVAIVLDGTAHVHGQVDALLVLGGDAVLEGARVGDMTIVSGSADLRNGTRIAGSVRLMDSQMKRGDDVGIAGVVSREPIPRWGALPFGFLFLLGTSMALFVAGLLAVAVAPEAMRSAGETLFDEPGKTILIAAILWLVMPPLAVLSLLTIVGIPVGVGALLFMLVPLAFLGYIVAGKELGERIMAWWRPTETPSRSYLATVVGLAGLMVMGIVPVVGALVGMLAAVLGSGAIALSAWRAWRRRGGRRDASLIAPSAARTQGPVTPDIAAPHH